MFEAEQKVLKLLESITVLNDVDSMGNILFILEKFVKLWVCLSICEDHGAKCRDGPLSKEKETSFFDHCCLCITSYQRLLIMNLVPFDKDRNLNSKVRLYLLDWLNSLILIIVDSWKMYTIE